MKNEKRYVFNKFREKLNFSPPIRKNSSGFTVLELLVGFSIIAIVAGIGVLSLVSYNRRSRIAEIANLIKEYANEARFNSISVVKPKDDPQDLDDDYCTDAEQLISYTVSLCYDNNPSCTHPRLLSYFRGYALFATCSPPSHRVLRKRWWLPSDINFSKTGITNPCKDITFASVRPQVSGAPCEVYLTGYGINTKISFDASGYVSF